MDRKIIVFSTLANKAVSIVTDVATWGELRNLSQVRSLMTQDMSAVIFETKTQLIDGESALPTGEFKLVLAPAKTKSGAEVVQVADVVASLREKFDAAFAEVMEEIERGEHSTYTEEKIDDSISKSDLDALRNFKI